VKDIEDRLALDGAGSELQASDPLLRQALDWVVKLKTGEPTRRDLDELLRWRESNPDHDAAFKRAVGIYRLAGMASTAVETSRLNRRRLTRRVLLGGAMAAAAAGILIVRPPLEAWPSLEELTADYRTAKGEQRTIDLDGASLELNTQTSLALRSGDREQFVELVSGEASVAATRPAERPLVMTAVQGRIVASTAEFNIRCLSGSVTVACLRGTITVEASGSAASVAMGREVSYDRRGLAPTVAIDTDAIGAWKAGLLIFKDRPLAAVVDEINRYRSGRIIIVRPALGERLLNGTFQIHRLDQFPPQVEQLLGARLIELPGGVVLLS